MEKKMKYSNIIFVLALTLNTGALAEELYITNHPKVYYCYALLNAQFTLCFWVEILTFLSLGLFINRLGFKS